MKIKVYGIRREWPYVKDIQVEADADLYPGESYTPPGGVVVTRIEAMEDEP